MTENSEHTHNDKIPTLGELVRMLFSGIDGLQGLYEFVHTTLQKCSAAWHKFTQMLHTAFEQYQIAEAEAVLVLKKYKWALSPSTPLSFMLEVIMIARQEDDRSTKINTLFVDFYTEDHFRALDALVEGWSYHPLFSARMKLLRDSVATMRLCHHDQRLNPSNVVLPLLLAQIDGILTDYCTIRGITRHGRGSNGWKEQFWEQIKHVRFADLFNSLLIDVVFQNAYHGEPLRIPTTLSRHKVMHGELTRYGRIAHVIRAFLILDFLAHLPVQKVTGPSGTAHVASF